MFLKHLINPKPSIIFFFIVFCTLFIVFPLIKIDLNTLFFHDYIHVLIVLFLSLTIPLFLSTGLNNIIYEKNIIRKDNLVIGVIFILISSPFINNVELWISGFLLLFLFNFLIDTYQKDLCFPQFYNASIILAIITFIYPNMIYLISLFIISGINYSNINWRIIVTIFLGFITPYLFYFITCFMTGANFITPQFFNFSIVNISMIEKICLSQQIPIIIFLVIILFSFFELFSWLYKKSIKSRRTFMTIIWFFIISILISISSGWQYFYFSLIPLAIIIGNYFVYTKNRRIANILFFMLIISSFYYKYWIVFNM